MGERAGAAVYERGTEPDPAEIAAWALGRARQEGKDVLIVDTAGRLHVDEELMEELVRVRNATKPHDVLLVLDAMTGQDAVNVAESFAEQVDFDGVVMTKLDGDSAAARRCRFARSPASRSSTRRSARSWTASSASTRSAWRRGSSAWATS